MVWTERQQRLLHAMGLRSWQPERAVAPIVPTMAHPPPAAMERTAPPVQAPIEAPIQPPMRAATAAVNIPSDPSRAAHIATLGWPALREAVAGCRACTLCESRTQPVFGTGHPQAHWMVIGEAPGAEEDASGEPFVGPSGALLDAMLAALGVSRDDQGDPARRVFIANTLKCRPPRNRNPQPAELAQCEPFLLRQVALVQPRIILAMGRFAIEALLRTSEPVGRLRGRVHRYEGVPLVASYHPAYLLRSPSEKAKAWDDLCLAAEVSERPPKA
jgi:uracil-DNA glycosylase